MSIDKIRALVLMALLALAALVACPARADTKISALPAASAIGGTEQIPLVQGGVTAAATPAQLTTYTNAHATACSDTQVPYASSGAYTCSSKLTWTDTSGLLALAAATPITTRTSDTSASTNAKTWQQVVDGSATASTFREQSCTDALVCTDWATALRANGTQPGKVSQINLTAQNASGFNSSIQVDATGSGSMITLSTQDNNPSTTSLAFGSGDMTFTGNLDADALFQVVNPSTGTSALAHEEYQGNNAVYDISVAGSTATALTLPCTNVVVPEVCADVTGGVAGTTVAWVTGGGTMALGTGGFTPRTNANTTSQTDGFFYLPKVAGVPTGVPAHLANPFANSLPFEYDSTDNRLYVYNSGWQPFGVNTGAADPTATVGLTATNGSATSFTRSDGAPALSLAIAPNFSFPWTASPWNWSNAEPRLAFTESDQGTDLKNWDFDVNGGVLAIRTRTDADGAGLNAITITRGTTTNISAISLGNSTSNPTFTLIGTGTFTAGNGTTTINSSGLITTNRVNVQGSVAATNGIYLPSANTLGFSTNSTVRGNFDANGTFNVNAAIASGGTKPTVTGCSNTTTLGGTIAGSYVSGTTGTCTVTITLPTGPTNGYACFAHDDTTAADYTQSAIVTSVTTLTISGTTVSGDKIVWGCPIAY